MSFLDALTYPWSLEEGRELHRLLSGGIAERDDIKAIVKAVRVVRDDGREATLPWHTIAHHLDPDHLWRSVLEKAHLREVLRGEPKGLAQVVASGDWLPDALALRVVDLCGIPTPRNLMSGSEPPPTPRDDFGPHWPEVQVLLRMAAAAMRRDELCGEFYISDLLSAAKWNAPTLVMAALGAAALDMDDLDHEPDWRAMAGLVEFLADSPTLRLAEENAVRLPLCHSPAQVVAKALRITDPDKDPPDVDDLTALRASARPHGWDHLL